MSESAIKKREKSGLTFVLLWPVVTSLQPIFGTKMLPRNMISKYKVSVKESGITSYKI